MKPSEQKTLKKAAKLGQVGADGRKDTILLHVNRAEVPVIQNALHNPGSINPRTKLLSFRYGFGGDKAGSGTNDGSGVGPGHGNTGTDHGGQGWGGVPGDRGLRGPLSNDGQSAGFTNGTGPAGAPNPAANPAGAPSIGVGSKYRSAQSDYANKSWLDRQIYDRPTPNNPATYAGGAAHIGMDPISGALGALSLAPVVGPFATLAGLGYRGYKALTGYPGPTVNLDSRFSPGYAEPGYGAPRGSPSSTPSGAPNGTDQGWDGTRVQPAQAAQPAGTQQTQTQTTQPASQLPWLLKLLTQPQAQFGANGPGLSDYSFTRPSYQFFGR
jgi:hypothetical protein